MILSIEDRYALARAFAGYDPHPAVPMTPIVSLLVRNWQGRTPSAEDVDAARKFFGQELITQVFSVDPSGPPPVSEDHIDVPRLPAKTQLTDKQQQAGRKVGQWLDLWMDYARQSASMTDPLFLESGGLWLIGLACARRVVMRLDFQNIYNNHYALWVAPTTYYRKSTGLRVVEAMARSMMGHLLLAGQSSPEMLLFKLAGQRTTNYDDLDPEQKQLEDLGRMFAGQRGFISDEMSKLFAKKYMEGLPEVLMEMAEAPNLVEQEYKGMGKLIVKNAFLSLLFATTPSRLQRIFTDGEWEDGLLPRFALLTPSNPVVVRTPAKRRSDAHYPGPVLTAGLKNLLQNLPQPRQADVLDGERVSYDAPQIIANLDNEALDAFNRYADALHDMTDPRSGLDYRLAGVYGRLPVHGLRVALSLAAIDWAVANDNKRAVDVTANHWYRAQGVVEAWRVSSHRLLGDVNRSSDEIMEEKVLNVLKMHHSKPPTKHEIYRRSKGGNRRDVYSAIEALQEAGIIQLVESGSRAGYQMVRTSA